MPRLIIPMTYPYNDDDDFSKYFHNNRCNVQEKVLMQNFCWNLSAVNVEKKLETKNNCHILLMFDIEA